MSPRIDLAEYDTGYIMYGVVRLGLASLYSSAAEIRTDHSQNPKLSSSRMSSILTLIAHELNENGPNWKARTKAAKAKT